MTHPNSNRLFRKNIYIDDHPTPPIQTTPVWSLIFLCTSLTSTMLSRGMGNSTSVTVRILNSHDISGDILIVLPFYCHMGVSINGGTPKWLFFFLEKMPLKWMIWDPHIWKPTYSHHSTKFYTCIPYIYTPVIKHS